MLECLTLSWKNTLLRAHPGSSALISTCLQGSVVTVLNGRKQNFSEMFEITSPKKCLQSGEDVMCCCPVSTTDLYKVLWHLCSWHLQKRGRGACISLCNAVSHIFPFREMTCHPKTLQAYWRLKWNSNLMTSAILLSEQIATPTEVYLLQVCE